MLGIVMRKFDTAKSLELEQLYPVGYREKNHEKLLMWRPESRDPAKIIIYLRSDQKKWNRNNSLRCNVIRENFF